MGLRDQGERSIKLHPRRCQTVPDYRGRRAYKLRECYLRQRMLWCHRNEQIRLAVGGRGNACCR
jgi:hypothetical protein